MFFRERLKTPINLPVILDKNKVPQFNDTIISNINKISARTILGKIDMNFRTGTTGACFTHLPEIVFFSKTDDMLRINIRIVLPYLKTLIIVMVDCCIETSLRQLPNFSKELPCPRYSFNFVIITKRPIAEHFKKGMVIGIPPNILQIIMLT